MYLLDLTHTSHCLAHTGVQRVSRSLYAELSRQTSVQPICYDHYAKHWRALNEDEIVNLNSPTDAKPESSRGHKWTLGQRSRSYLDLIRGHRGNLDDRHFDGLIVPEIFSDRVGQAYALLKPRLSGPMVAVCHDLLAITHSDLSPPGVAERFPIYLEQLRQFDGIAANSVDTDKQLRAYWDKKEQRSTPQITHISLGADIEAAEVLKPSHRKTRRILCVGTLEARKNHLTLLEAAELLWRRGLEFELILAGMLHLETGTPAMEKITSMQKTGRPVEWLGTVSEKRLRKEFSLAHFTVYPSIAEGFGLPVAESLRFGRSCVTSDRGAIAEIARGGGCLMVDTSSASQIAAAMAKLLTDDEFLGQLTHEAATRHLSSWYSYAKSLLTWIKSLRHQPTIPKEENVEVSIAKTA